MAKGISESHYENGALVPLELVPSFNEFMGSNNENESCFPQFFIGIFLSLSSWKRKQNLLLVQNNLFSQFSLPVEKETIMNTCLDCIFSTAVWVFVSESIIAGCQKKHLSLSVSKVVSKMRNNDISKIFATGKKRSLKSPFQFSKWIQRVKETIFNCR